MILTPKRRSIGVAAPGSIRRFSPDGRYLVVFAMDQATILLYTVNSTWHNGASFDDFFTLHQTISVPLGENELLCRDFCLFLADSEHFVVASAFPSGLVDSASRQGGKWSNPRSMTTFEHLDNVSFHLISLLDLSQKDRLQFQNDYILLANHGGVSLFGDRFAVCSLQHQSVLLFRIVDGKFVAMARVGHYCDLSMLHGQTDGLVMGLWHKLWRFLYENSEDKNWFHGVGRSLNNLCIHKVQFIDPFRLLIKMVPNYYLAQRTSSNEQPHNFLFVIYNTDLNTVEMACNFKDLLNWVLENDQLLRRTASEDPHTIVPSLSDCHDTRHAFLKHIEGVKGTKRINTLRKLMFAFPYSPQSLSTSPLMDQAEFRFDEKFFGKESKWRPSPDYPIRFIHRENESLAFVVEPWADQPMANMWTPIEGDSGILTEYVQLLVGNEELSVQDVFSFDELHELSGLEAVIINYPLSVKVNIPDQPAQAKFIKQTVENACCTVALLHAVSNRNYLQTAKPLLEYKEIHQQFAVQGETAVDDDTEMHYIAIVPVGGRAVWLDGRREGPVDLGLITGSFGQFVADRITGWLDLTSTCFFAAFALVKST